jgi:hypothetical protein
MELLIWMQQQSTMPRPTAVPQRRQPAEPEINRIVAIEHGEGGSNAWIEVRGWQSLELMGLWHTAERMEAVAGDIPAGISEDWWT